MSISLPSKKPSLDTEVGSFFATKVTYCSPSTYILFWWDHFLCQWTCTALLIVLCHSEWCVECLPFSSSFISFFSPFLPAEHQLWGLYELQQCPVPLRYRVPDMVNETDATSSHWAFYFQGSGVPISCSGTRFGSIWKMHIALQGF